MTSFALHQPDPASARLLAQYASQYDVTEARKSESASVSMTIDGRYRVRLRALPGGGVSVLARLRTLPEPGAARDRLVTEVARLACGTLLESRAACVIDSRDRAIWLHCLAPAGSSQDIDDAVGDLANALAFWTPAVAVL